MGIFGLKFETYYYPVFGFDGGMRAMTADEILQVQFNQIKAMQNAWPNSWASSLSSLGAIAAYQTPRKPLDERFADFKVRLAATTAKYPALSTTSTSPPT